MDKLSNTNLSPTPKTLEEAVYRALAVGPLNMVITRTRAHVRDFIAQKFAAAYLKAESEAELERLVELWNQITDERNDNGPTDPRNR